MLSLPPLSYILPVAIDESNSLPPNTPKRPWKGVLFPCCGVYGRIYQSLATGRFEGNCPKCGQAAKLGMWSMIFALFLLLPLFGLQSASAADLSAIDSVKPQINEPAPKIRQGLTPLESTDTVPLAKTVKQVPDSLLKSPKTSKLDTTNLMGKKEVTRDSVRFSIFAQTGVSFLSFGERGRFAQALDTMYRDYLGDALNPKDSARVKKQNFQNVNFCFPVYGGVEFRLGQSHHIALGSGIIYDKETVILTDRNSNPHEVYYVIQAFPLFLEWRIGISPRLITLDGHERFSASLRYWWLLGGTEIYSNWGAIKANRDWTGQGWGFSLGYQLLEWKRIRIHGDLGFAVLQATSDSPWSQVVPDYSNKAPRKASWELGGIQLNLRANLGLFKD